MERDLGSTTSSISLVSDEKIGAQVFHFAQGEFTASGHIFIKRATSRHVLGTASTIPFTLAASA